MNRDFIDVLKKKDFLLLWVGQFISLFGDRLNQLALIAIIVKESSNSTLELSRLLFFMVLPALIFAPIAGVFVDRWDYKRTMIITDLIRSVLVISIPYLSLSESFWPIYTIVFFVFALSRFFIPAKLAIIPELVKREELFVANSISTMATIMAMIAGMFFGGLIVAGVGTKIALFLDGASYILSALFLVAIVTRPEEREESSFRSFFEDLKIGFKYLFRQRTVYGSILVLFILMSGAGIMAVEGIAFLRKQFGTSELEARHFIKILGIVGSMLGIGMSLGALITSRYGHRFKEGHIFTLPIIGIGGSILLMIYTRSPLLVGIALFAIGLLGITILVFINATLHRLIPKSLYGRVFSSIDIINNLSLLSSILLAGFMPLLDERAILKILAMTLVGFGLIGYLVTLRRCTRFTGLGFS